MINMRKIAFLSTFLVLCSYLCSAQTIRVGADHLDQLLPLLEGKCVGITGNQTSVLSDANHTHLLDTLLARQVRVTKLYSPEHGFRGDADAGASVRSGKDARTGLPIISLYGNNKKPSLEQLKGIDIMVFDLQDVGVRFYTYISTLKYVLEACADAGIPVLILDRPNPHDTVDGPVLKESKYKSFISLLPIPAVHGMTMGEIGMMLVGEKWLDTSASVDLRVISVSGWQHGLPYDLPVPPSPNLRSRDAIRMYPTLCYFEATTWSVGRGTEHPFEQIGYPDARMGKKAFTPKSRQGASNPKYQGKKCYGPVLCPSAFELGINLDIIIDAAKLNKKYGLKFIDRPATFNLLAGNGELKRQIESGWSAQRIRATWQEDLKKFRSIRQRYLLYPDGRKW